MASPIYPGYYPGKPIYRDRRFVVKAEEVKMGAMEDFLTRVYEKANIPRWIYEKELETIRESLVIEAEDESSFSPSEVVGEGAEDLQEAKGASVRISLDPSEWVEDPKKEFIEEFIRKPLASITDWDEYRSEAKGLAWNNIISGQDRGLGAPGSPYKLYNNSGAVDPREKFYGVPGETPEDVVNPAKAAVSYMQTSVNSKVRNLNHHAYNIAAIGALVGEFNTLDPTSFSGGDRESFESINASLNRTSDALKGMGDLYKASKGLVDDGNKKLTFRISDLGVHKDKKKGTEYINRDEFDAAFKNAKRNLSRLATPEELATAKKSIALLDHIEKNLYDPSGVLIASDDKVYTLMKKQIPRMHNTSIGGGIIFEMGKGAMKDLDRSKDLVATLNSKTTDAAGVTKNVTSDSSRALFRLNRVIRNDWEWEAMGDALTDLTEGKIPYQIVWQRFVLPRIERYTPSFWIKGGINKVIEVTPLKKLVGAYQNLFAKLQKNFIGKAFLALQNPKEQFKAKIVAWATNLIAGAIAVGTGGLGWIATQVLKVALRFGVNKASEFLADAWKRIKKGEFFDVVAEATYGVLKVIGVVAASCFGVVVGVMMIIMVIISAFSVEDATKVATNIEGRETLPEGLPAFGGYTKSTCQFTEDVLDLTFPNNSSNGPARAGYELVADLMRGFWCYWNHQPDYDSANDPRDLFDELRFEADAFPGNLNNCADCLFWCTWLPYIAYNSSFDQNVKLLSAQAMTDFFRSQTFIEPNQPGAWQKVKAGDIAFFRTGSGGWHTGMVYYVNVDVVMTIHSNAPYKQLGLTVANNGAIQTPDSDFGSFLTLLGFGRPK